jgi:hypothetical protein
MSNQPIKIVRPWPAEQPRPPMVTRGVISTERASVRARPAKERG